MEIYFKELEPLGRKIIKVFGNETLKEGSEVVPETKQKTTINKAEYEDMINKHGKPIILSKIDPFMRSYLEKGFIVIKQGGEGVSQNVYFASKNVNRIGKVYRYNI